MKVRFQADNDFKQAILYGVLRREPTVGFQTTIGANLFGLSDQKVLAQAANENSLPATHDRKMMPRHFADFLSSGRASAGVTIISQRIEVGEAIDALFLVWAASETEEWRNRISELPFR